VKGKEIQRRQGSTGADKLAFRAPGTLGGLKDSEGAGEVGVASRSAGKGLRRCPGRVPVPRRLHVPDRRLSRGPPTTDHAGRESEHSVALEGSVPGPRLTARLRPRPQLPPPTPIPPFQAPSPTTRLPRCPLKPGGREDRVQDLMTNRQR
jgi:hypothetical protein